MESNLNLDIGFKGQLKLKAQAVPMMEGYLKLGGVTDPDGADLEFGVVVSADPTTPNLFEAGAASGNVVRGVSVFDDAIAQNAPAHPNKYLAGLPCAAITHGFFYIAGWTKNATAAIDPVIGCKVIYNTTTGVIEFLASTGSAPSGWAELTNADVRDVTSDNGALIYLA
jgi:hypothetical protein